MRQWFSAVVGCRRRLRRNVPLTRWPTSCTVHKSRRQIISYKRSPLGHNWVMKVNNYRIGPGENLECADLSNADLTGADLSSANLGYAILSNADLTGADLNGTSLKSADLSNADMTNADLSNANLECADLSNADMTNADLSNANLECADLSNADLTGADLSNANLGYAILSNADLTGANLGNANFEYAELTDADLPNAHLSGGNVTQNSQTVTNSGVLIQNQIYNEFSPQLVSTENNSPAAWHTDPSGRFELRYWNGKEWTEHVVRESRQLTDSLQPITQGSKSSEKETSTFWARVKKNFKNYDGPLRGNHCPDCGSTYLIEIPFSAPIDQVGPQHAGQPACGERMVGLQIECGNCGYWF